MLISKVFGYLGGIGTTISFLPQVVKIYKQNNNEGLSIYMFLIHLSGVSSWIIYGIYINDIIVILYNSITLSLIFFIILKYLNNEYKSRSNMITE
jgi:MtN3 and saliva related transmembrane protein